MALIIKEIKLEVSKPNLIQAIVAKQNDCNSRFLKVSLWDEGVQIPIRPNSQVTINAERKDGKSDSFFGEVNDDNTVTVPLHSWMLELDGTVNCDVSIFVDERKLTTTTFVVSVEKASNNSDDISTDPQYDVLINLIEEVSELKENLATVDQTYNANSENAQSGKAVAQAIANAGGGGGGGAVASVNGQTGHVSLDAVDVGALPNTTKIPSKVSDLTNDKGYISGYTETDPTVPSWAKAATKPTYTASEVGALPSTTVIPSKTSQLTNDSGFINTETDPTVPSWAKAATKPSYSKSEVGLGNVDNVKQYSASNPPPYPVTKVNNKTGAVTLSASDVGAVASSELNSAVNAALSQAKASGEFDGKTPVKGTDYFTEADKAEMVEDVVEVMEGIPSYWKPALDEGVKAINAAVETAGRNKSAFLFYTDAHWGYGSGMSPNLLKYLGKNTAINKTIFGGDFGNTYEYPSTGKTMDDWMEVMRSWKLAVRDIPNHHSVVGNHDQEVQAISNDKALYGFLFAPEETPDIVRGGDFFYYIDEPSEKTRYLYLNTGLCNFSDEQCKFAIEALKTTPAE